MDPQPHRHTAYTYEPTTPIHIEVRSGEQLWKTELNATNTIQPRPQTDRLTMPKRQRNKTVAFNELTDT